jgi:hypothetical protein
MIPPTRITLATLSTPFEDFAKSGLLADPAGRRAGRCQVGEAATACLAAMGPPAGVPTGRNTRRVGTTGPEMGAIPRDVLETPSGIVAAD